MNKKEEKERMLLELRNKIFAQLQTQQTIADEYCANLDLLDFTMKEFCDNLKKLTEKETYDDK